MYANYYDVFGSDFKLSRMYGSDFQGDKNHGGLLRKVSM